MPETEGQVRPRRMAGRCRAGSETKCAGEEGGNRWRDARDGMHDRRNGEGELASACRPAGRTDIGEAVETRLLPLERGITVDRRLVDPEQAVPRDRPTPRAFRLVPRGPSDRERADIRWDAEQEDKGESGGPREGEVALVPRIGRVRVVDCGGAASARTSPRTVYGSVRTIPSSAGFRQAVCAVADRHS